jgi:hypothetical protein
MTPSLTKKMTEGVPSRLIPNYTPVGQVLLGAVLAYSCREDVAHRDVLVFLVRVGQQVGHKRTTSRCGSFFARESQRSAQILTGLPS